MFGINPYRVKNIKLAKTDRNIIKELLKERQGIGLYLLARRLNKDVAHIYRRLSKMVNYGVISKIKSSVTIYSINDKQHKEIVLIDVECPKCHTIRKVDIKQTSILCSNEDCLTNTGKRTRFYVYQKRIINYNNI